MNNAKIQSDLLVLQQRIVRVLAEQKLVELRVVRAIQRLQQGRRLQQGDTRNATGKQEDFLHKHGDCGAAAASARHHQSTVRQVQQSAGAEAQGAQQVRGPRRGKL